MEAYERRFMHHRNYMLFLIAGALFIVPLLFLVRPEGQAANLWFGRTGAPMTVFALLAQYEVNYLERLLTPNSFTTREFETYRRKKQPWVSAGKVLSLLLTVIGTVIWGFGDLLKL